jgi:methionyl-tRNA synthetase
MKKDLVTFPDFQKLDFRVGKVIKAEEVVGSTNLIRMTVDLGKDYGKQKIIAGLAKYCKREDIQGKKFLFIANLSPKQMMKELSNGMMLCGDNEGEIALIPVNNKFPEGMVVR